MALCWGGAAPLGLRGSRGACGCLWEGLHRGGAAPEKGDPWEGVSKGRSVHGKVCLWEGMPQEGISKGRDAPGTSLSQGGHAPPVTHRPLSQGRRHTARVHGDAEDPAAPILQGQALGEHVQRSLGAQPRPGGTSVVARAGGTPAAGDPPPGASPFSRWLYLAAAVADVLPLPPGLSRCDGAQDAGDVDNGSSAATHPALCFGLGCLLQQGQECLQGDWLSNITILFLLTPTPPPTPRVWSGGVHVVPPGLSAGAQWCWWCRRGSCSLPSRWPACCGAWYQRC